MQGDIDKAVKIKQIKALKEAHLPVTGKKIQAGHLLIF